MLDDCNPNLDLSFLIKENGKLLSRLSRLEEKFSVCKNYIRRLPFRVRDGEYVNIVFPSKYNIDEIFDIIDELRSFVYEDC